MGTTLSDIIVPELFNPYVIQKTLEKSALVQSGIVQNDAEFDKLASQASPLVNMPFFSDLTGESETVIEGDDLTADKISSKKDVAVILRRAKMWSATDLSAAMSGADPMAAIASLVSDFWVRDLQKELIAVLKGIFGTIPQSPTVRLKRLKQDLRQTFLICQAQAVTVQNGAEVLLLTHNSF